MTTAPEIPDGPLDVTIATRPSTEARVLEERAQDVENKSLLFGASYTGHQIPNATLHVWSRRLDGSLKMTVQNAGKAPLVATKLTQFKTSVDGQTLFDATRGLGMIRRGQGAPVEQKWEVRGALDVLWNLTRILFTGAAAATQTINLQAIGYKKSYSNRIVVPVRGVSVRWD